jgi:hypothetical protein
MKMFKMMK